MRVMMEIMVMETLELAEVKCQEWGTTPLVSTAQEEEQEVPDSDFYEKI